MLVSSHESSNVSYRVQGARYQREAHIKSRESSFDEESLLHSLKYKSMICTLAAYRALPSYVHGLIVKGVIRLPHVHGLSRQ